VYSPKGELLSTRGEDIFTGRPHGITITPDGIAYCVEDMNSTVHKFSLDGKELGVIGPAGNQDKNVDNEQTAWKNKDLLDGSMAMTTLEYQMAMDPEGFPPFNRPTKAAVAPNGDIYVSDGYRNCKVHRFSPEGELIQSWGRAGLGPGEFHVVHSVMISPDGKVYVADRENDRVQVFTLDGTFLAQWTNAHRPHRVMMGPEEGIFYVAEARVKPGRYTLAHGPSETDLPVRISMRDETGAILGEIAGAELFGDPHGLVLDSQGNLYVVGSRKLQKYARI
jgi:hypothetical protein